MRKFITIYHEHSETVLACTLCGGEGAGWSRELLPGFVCCNHVMQCPRCGGTRREPEGSSTEETK